jgi:hypothetical protein
MGTRQSKCWSLEGAHFLLQVRCAELDGRLETLGVAPEVSANTNR